MFKLTFCALSISGVMLRYSLMVGVVVAAGFSGYWWLAVLALPILLSTILGVKIERTTSAKATKRSAKPAKTTSSIPAKVSMS